ncbi:MAG: glycosyltransferase family 4 protein, partial [Candidatus Limnocylindrales bacterium]
MLIVHPRDLAEPTGGGIQTFLRDFVTHSPLDFEISVAGFTADPRARPVGTWSTVEIGQRRARFLPVARSGSLARQPLGLARTLGALRTLRHEMRQPGTILQLHRPYRAFLLAGHRGPRVQIIHLDLDAWPGPSGWHRLSWLYRDFADGLEQFDRVFVANEAGAEKLRLENPSAAPRIEYLSGWYDDGVFNPRAHSSRDGIRDALCATFGLPAPKVSEKWVLFVGRLDQIKAPELMVDSFAELARTAGQPVRLIVCGDGPMLPAVLRRAGERDVADRTHVIGDQPRDVVAQLMAAADVLIVTSEAEGGGPRVVLEALGSGLPVVSTIVGEVRRSVTSGSNGWLAEARTADALAAGLRWALEQPREPIATTAANAARSFIASAVLQPLYDRYRELARSPTQGRG